MAVLPPQPVNAIPTMAVTVRDTKLRFNIFLKPALAMPAAVVTADANPMLARVLTNRTAMRRKSSVTCATERRVLRYGIALLAGLVLLLSVPAEV